MLGARSSSCADGRDGRARTGFFWCKTGVVCEETPVPTRNLPLRAKESEELLPISLNSFQAYPLGISAFVNVQGAVVPRGC